MTFFIVLSATALLCVLLRNRVRRHPLAFYAVCVLFDAALLYCSFFGAPRWLGSAMYVLMQKCMLPLSLFVVVMYVGCFPKRSLPERWFMPIRGELSIMACILALGHIAFYLASYLPRVMAGSSLGLNVLSSFFLALALLALMLVLGATSFKFVRRRMDAALWKRVQRASYLFFGLTYAHLVLMLFPSALSGGAAAQLSIGSYSVVFLVYFIWRVLRARYDAQEAAGCPEQPACGFEIAMLEEARTKPEW